MNVSGPFIRRPVATTLLALAVFIGGLLAYTRLPIAPLPQVDFPTINVSANLPGASPETMASAVATPLERRLGRIAGVTEITSVSSLGATSLTLQFDLTRDVDSCARDVQAAIVASGGELPTNLPFRPSYRKVNPADAPILILSLRSDTLPLGQVFDAANTVLAQKVSQVPGVGQVFVGGGQQPAVRVSVDPELLAGAGLGLEDVRRSIAEATVDQPKGSISGAVEAQSIAANDQLFSAAQFKQVIVSHKSGAAIRLGDVATVADDVENNRLAAWADGKRAVVMVVRRQPGANILETIAGIKAVLPRLTESVSPAIHVDVAIDRAQMIRASVAEVEHTLLLSIGLVVLVVFAFLRSVRATLIPSVAVPLSLVATFAFMYALGYSLDNLSLMALTIATGFVVDDAIVVTENVARLLEEGKPPLEAALEGAKQIAFTIISITVSLIAVFIPILLMGGVVGRLFREFAVVLAISVAVSAVVSLTLTPMMCAKLLRHAPKEEENFVARIFERAFSLSLRAYDVCLTLVLRFQRTTQLVALGTVGLTVYLGVLVPKGLFPQQDSGQVSGFSDAPQDISFPAMKARQEALNAVVAADPDVDHFVSFMGAGGLTTVNTGSIFIQLKPRGQRKGSSDDFINRLRPKLAPVQGIQLYLQAMQDVRLGGRPTRTQYQYTLQDADLEELRAWSPRMLEALRQAPELRDVASDQQLAGLRLGLSIDRDTAARLGVTPGDVDAVLYDAYGQRQVATMFMARNQYRVVMEVKPEFQRGPESLDRLFVRSSTGAQIPIRALTRAETGPTALTINHQGQFPSVTLSFNVAPGAALGQAVEAIHRAEQRVGLPTSVHAGFAGTAQAFGDSLSSQPMLIAAALFTVYLVLGMLYESAIHPITILSTLPSAGVGALLALLVFKVEFSIIALIGIILLIGIVKKNAIMMIDVAIELSREGVPQEQAIHRACLQRFRPIVMTTLAALLGALPLALGSGMGAELRKPLGIAIVGGLIVSQALTLFTTPVIYLQLDRLRNRFVRARAVSPSGGAGGPEARGA